MPYGFGSPSAGRRVGAHDATRLSSRRLFCAHVRAPQQRRPRRRIRRRRIRRRTTLRRTIPLSRTIPPRITRPRTIRPRTRKPSLTPLNPAAPYPVQPHYRVPHKPSEELSRDAEAALAHGTGPRIRVCRRGLAERVEDLAEARAAELRQQAEQANQALAAEQTAAAGSSRWPSSPW